MSAQQSGTLILASGSPRRREILAQLGLAFEVIVSSVEEPPHTEGEPTAYARGLAELKAHDVARRLRERNAGQHQDATVLGSDTIVVVGRDVLGKPVDDRDAVDMLTRMQGRTHVVITAVAVVPAGQAQARTIDVRTAVRFRSFDAATAARYVASGEGRDKAGSYAMQGLGGGLVEAIEGSYSNVIGLPAVETLALLTDAGVLRCWP